MKLILLISILTCLFFSCNKTDQIEVYSISFVDDEIVLPSNITVDTPNVEVTLKLTVSEGYDDRGGFYFEEIGSGIKVLNSIGKEVTISVSEEANVSSGVKATLYNDGEFSSTATIMLGTPPFNASSIIYIHDDYIYTAKENLTDSRSLFSQTYYTGQKPTLSGNKKFVSYRSSNNALYLKDESGNSLDIGSSRKFGGFVKGTQNTYYYVLESGGYYSSSYYLYLDYATIDEKFSFPEFNLSNLGFTSLKDVKIVYDKTNNKFYAAVLGYMSSNSYSLVYYNGSAWETIFSDRNSVDYVNISLDGATVAWVQGAQTYQSWTSDELRVYYPGTKQEGSLVYSTSSYSNFDIEGFDFSPDGSIIVFSVEKGNTSFDLYSVSSGGGYVTTLTSTSYIDEEMPFWLD